MQASENIVGKGTNAGFQHFLIFRHCFQVIHRQTILTKSELSSAYAFNLDRPKILSFDKEADNQSCL